MFALRDSLVEARAAAPTKIDVNAMRDRFDMNVDEPIQEE